MPPVKQLITTPPAGSLPRPRKVLSLFGTRPEAIKMAPVIAALAARPECFVPVNVSSSQHTDLLRPLIEAFHIPLHHDLQVMQPNQTLSSLSARVLASLDPILLAERPDLLLVQGDTTTALAGAIAAFHRGIPVGHVEAGLRSGNRSSPFPEEMNRRLITRLASLHFAATLDNRDALRDEHVPADTIFVTGNPVVDALRQMLPTAVPSPALAEVLQQTAHTRRILLTTHRRESFGQTLLDNLHVLRAFVQSHPDVSLIFPVHPNPAVSGPARETLGQCERVHLVAPLEYSHFLAVMSQAWLIVSDSGGVQEEAPSLGKPLLILRENTERPEALLSGCAKLAPKASALAAALEEALLPGSWVHGVSAGRNPFGDGHAATRIVEAIARTLGVYESTSSPVAA